VRPFDFRRPNQLNRDHLRNLQIVHETFARQFTTVLSSTLRAIVHVSVTIDQLTYDEFLTRGLKVADATSVSLARDNDLDMIVFNLSEPGTIARAVTGEKIGTRLSRD
jgi:flagellar motor switch protein FliM